MLAIRITTSGDNKPWAVWNEGRVSLGDNTDVDMAGKDVLDFRGDDEDEVGMVSSMDPERFLKWFAADILGGVGNKYNVTADPSSRWVDRPPERFTADVNRILRDDSEVKDRGCNDGPNAYDSVHVLEVKTTRAVTTRETIDTRDEEEERRSSIVPFGLTTGGGSRYLISIAIVSVPRLWGELENTSNKVQPRNWVIWSL